MATIKSDLVTKQEAALTDITAGLEHGDDFAGIVLYATAIVTIPATPEVDDIIELVPAEAVPAGAVVIPQLSHVYCVTDPGTALNLDIGIADLEDKFADNLALTAAGLVSFAASGTPPDGIASPYRMADPADIIATVKTSTGVVETVAVFTIAYRAKA